MKCELVHELLSGYIDNELSQEQRQMVEQHLQECAKCARELEMMRMIDESIKQEPVEEPSRDFVFTLNRRVQERIAVRPGFRWFKVVPILIPVAVAALVMVILKNVEPVSDVVNVNHRVAYTEVRSGPDLDVKVPKVAPRRALEYEYTARGGTADRLKEEPVAPAPAIAPAEKKYSSGKAAASEAVTESKDDELDGLLARDKVTVLDIPEGRIVRAIVDTNGRILRVATGRNIVPEPDTVLENRLQGQQLMAPTVAGEKQQLYIDLTIQKDTCR